MYVSLIITTYNRPDALLLVLRSIEVQTIKSFEVIIADDGSSTDTKEVITSFQEKTNLTIIHSCQEDKGFRAAKSRNKAIAKASGDYIILVDGDMILHPQFVEDHINNAELGYFIQGSRVLLTQQKTNSVLNENNINFSFTSSGLLNRKNAVHSNSLSKLFSNKKNILGGIKSCNMAFFKKDYISVNGFNNEFKGWGREDSEFIVRLQNNGIRRKNVRFNAIQFHLWHQENTRASLVENDSLLQAAIENKIKWCDNGLNSVNSNEN
jgi:glycosyltransferase involved in cell wall biosynthesis